jgi:O-antigen ligase
MTALASIRHAGPTEGMRPPATWPWIAVAGAMLLAGVGAALIHPLAGVAALALPLLPLLVLAPDLALLGLTATLPFDAIASLVDARTLSLTRLLGVAVLAGWILWLLIHRERVRVGRPALALLAYVLFAAVSISWASDTSVTMRGLRTLSQLFLLSVMAANVFTRWDRLARMLDVLLAGTAVLAVLTLVQLGPGTARATLSYGDQTFQPNALAAALAVPALAALALRARTGPLGAWRLAALVPIVPALIATGSRGGMLSLAVGMAVIACCRPRLGLRTAGALAVVLLFAPFVIPADVVTRAEERWAGAAEDRLSGRLDIWRVGIAMVADRPLQGTGFFGFRDAFYEYMLETPVDPHFALVHSRGNRAAHNVYLATVAELGLAGGALLVVALGAHARLLWQLRRAAHRVGNEEAEDVATALLAMVGAVIVAGAGTDLLLTKTPWLLLGSAQGAALAAGWFRRSEAA